MHIKIYYSTKGGEMKNKIKLKNDGGRIIYLTTVQREELRKRSIRTPDIRDYGYIDPAGNLRAGKLFGEDGYLIFEKFTLAENEGG